VSRKEWGQNRGAPEFARWNTNTIDWGLARPLRALVRTGSLWSINALDLREFWASNQHPGELNGGENRAKVRKADLTTRVAANWGREALLIYEWESRAVGDRVRLSGGYDLEPAWLQGKQHYTATVTRFIPGPNDVPAVVAHLDTPVFNRSSHGEIVVLELRYKGTNWCEVNTLHVELCDSEPEPKTFEDRRQGKWIESHAMCEKLQSPITGG
jgi:hypothetical protein